MHFKRARFQTPCQVKMSMAHEIPEPSHQHSSAFIGYKYPPIRSNKCSNFLGLADLLSLFIFICCNASDIVSVTARAHVHVPDPTWPKRRLPVVLAPWRKGPKVCPENHLTMSKKRNKRTIFEWFESLLKPYETAFEAFDCDASFIQFPSKRKQWDC